MTCGTVTQLCHKGRLSQAVRALDLLVQANSNVPVSLFRKVLKQCILQNDVVLGERVHHLLLGFGYAGDMFLANQLLRMYASQGRLREAMDVFTKVVEPGTFMWSNIIAAYAKHGQAMRAIQLYHQMCITTVKPDGHVFVAALQACAAAGDLDSGKQVHSDVLNSGVPPDLFVCSCLVDMYAKCGSLEDARSVFNQLDTRDVVIWNSMLSGYVKQGRGHEALALYEQMDVEGVVPPNPVTFACLLKACAEIGALRQGEQLHAQIAERGLVAHSLLGTCLVDMYAKLGKVEDARRVFDSLVTKNVVTWTAMITGYADNERCREALFLYDEMELDGMIVADPVTFACLLNTCAKVGALQKGKQLHSRISERGFESDTVVGTSLVAMYAKCGQLEDARNIFDNMLSRNVITWTAMMTGYVVQQQGQESLSLYEEMEREGVIVADPVMFACLLKACASSGALQQGIQLHARIVQIGLDSDMAVGNSLVDMYAKCGRLHDACRVFAVLPAKDVVTWTMLINGFGRSNQAHKAIQCFHDMGQTGVDPNSTTFLCLLVACSHEGLVNEGKQLFKAMVEEHNIQPTIEHYTCMVDLLGRAGYLHEAEKMLASFDGDDIGYMSLLGACRSHCDVDMGMRCFQYLVRSDCQNAGAYVLMGNIYADAGRWSDVERIERLRKAAGAHRKPAVAGIEVDRRVHTFVVGEKEEGVSSKARSLNVRLREEEGHVPNTELVLKPLMENEKQDELCGHAEKLALAYGLLYTPDGSPLLVTKNLRMCRDCHRSTEIISRIEKRDITVRDAHRVHQFVDGSCCCGGRP